MSIFSFLTATLLKFLNLKQMLNILFGKSNIFTPFPLATFCKTKYYYFQKQLSLHSLLKFFHTHSCTVFFFFILLPNN